MLEEDDGAGDTVSLPYGDTRVSGLVGELMIQSSYNSSSSNYIHH